GDAAARLGDEPLASPDDTWTQDGDAWTTTAPEAGTLHVLRWTRPVELTPGDDARLTFQSQLSAIDARAHVQVSFDGETWMTLALVGVSDAWQDVEVDLSAFRGLVVHVRFAFEGATTATDSWRLRDVRVEIEPSAAVFGGGPSRPGARAWGPLEAIGATTRRRAGRRNRRRQRP
ncbi:MAG: hypothetical protein IT184_16280, partial [Acidobacteria bacterium]|nr:hypothetical protein [Acidobacteriota bacterium]